MTSTRRRPTVLLFDIDGTLLRTGGAGSRSMSYAFGHVCDRPDALAGEDFRGLTDLLILRLGLERIGRAVEPGTMAALREAYLSKLAEEVPRSAGYTIMPGVVEVLETVTGCGTYAVGLGTGNWEAGAEIKLTHGELWKYFSFGGYGCDAEDRVELIRAGALRGAHQLGRELAACRVVIIGDTPRDIHAAHRIGAECVAVQTGGHSQEALAEAEWVFDTLEHPEALPVLLG